MPENHRFCPKCGTQTLPEASFCARCGIPLGEIAAPPPAMPSPLVTPPLPATTPPPGTVPNSATLPPPRRPVGERRYYKKAAHRDADSKSMREHGFEVMDQGTDQIDGEASFWAQYGTTQRGGIIAPPGQVESRPDNGKTIALIVIASVVGLLLVCCVLLPARILGGGGAKSPSTTPNTTAKVGTASAIARLFSTVTPIPATATPPRPTATATLIPPTATPTEAPPTATAAPSTATPIPPTPTPVGPILVMAQLVSVPDAATIVVRLPDNSEVPVLLIGIDAPFPRECFGAESVARTRTLLEGHTVELEADVKDKDGEGRLLRYVWVWGDDGVRRHVNLELAKGGLAGVYNAAPNLRYQADLDAAQKNAQSQKVGLWEACGKAHAAIPPTPAPRPVPPNTPIPAVPSGVGIAFSRAGVPIPAGSILYEDTATFSTYFPPFATAAQTDAWFAQTWSRLGFVYTGDFTEGGITFHTYLYQKQLFVYGITTSNGGVLYGVGIQK